MGIKDKLEYVQRILNNRMLTPTEKFDRIKAECNADVVFKRPETRSMKEIEVSILRHFFISGDDLQKKTREHRIVVARQLAHYLSSIYTNESYAVIARYFGGKKHSIVVWSVSQIEKYLKTDKNFNLVHGDFIESFKK